MIKIIIEIIVALLFIMLLHRLRAFTLLRFLLTLVHRPSSQSVRQTLRALLPFIVVGLFGYALFSLPALLSAFWLGTTFLLRLLMMISFMVVQFVALFAFISRTKTEIILPGDEQGVTLDDYWGQPHLVELMNEWVGFLRKPAEFEEMGGRMVRGILLSGPPGTGKTFLSRCLSGSANLPFVSIEGSGFRGMFVGVDVLKMMQYLNKCKKLAREYGACIAFIDEIDAVGASRGGVETKDGGLGSTVNPMMMGGGMMGGSGALTRLLVEMDGMQTPSLLEKYRKMYFEWRNKPYKPKPQHVMFIGSTNRPGILDPALTRPGRFDKKVVVDPPSRNGRREIIQGYLRRITQRDVDVEALVSDTTNWTPAEVESAITKDAVRFAVRGGRDYVNHNDIDLALQEAKMGLENPVGEMAEDQRRALAVHEAGHAVAQYYLMPDTRIVRLTIVRHGRAYGYMMPADEVEQYIVPHDRMVAMFQVSIASREAEKLVLNMSYNSVAGDYRNAKRMLGILYSSGYFGAPVYAEDSKEVVEKLALGFWEEQEKAVREVLENHRDKLDVLTEALLAKSSLGSLEIQEIFS